MKPIGSLTADILKSARPKDTTSSKSTGSPKASRTSLQDDGRNINPTTALSTTGFDPTSVTDMLTSIGNPFSANKSLAASLKLARPLKPIYAGPGDNLMIDRFEPQPDAPAEAIAIIRQSLMAASAPLLIDALAKLELTTRRRTTQETDTARLIIVYLDLLSEIPGDIALWALQKWPRKSKWFPTWNELYSLCEEPMRDRRKMLEALIK